MSRLCALYGVSPAGYYAWRKRGISSHAEQDRKLAKRIRKIFEKSHETYGAPRVQEALRRQGIRVSQRRITRLMAAGEMRARVTRIYRPRAKQRAMFAEHDNRLWGVESKRCDAIWVGDVTYLKVIRHWCYLAIVLDRYSRRLLAWSLMRTRTTKLTRAVLDAAYRSRQPNRLIFHSDRGVEYTAPGYRDRLKSLGVRQSTTSGGSPGENAHAESFFHSLKADVIHGVEFPTDERLRACVKKYIRYYNYERLHSSRNYQTPVEFERRTAQK